jgi:AraC-like DNA-binding protein
LEPRVRVILRILGEQEARSHWCLRDAASLLGLSQEHLQRLFKREVGVPFRQYLRRSRIEAAAEMLKSNALSIKETAVASGYNDVSNFHRDFKRVYGLSPRQWRLAQLTLRIESSESSPTRSST